MTSCSFLICCIFRKFNCRGVLQVVSPSDSAFRYLLKESLVSSAFLISLAAVFNRIILLSNPRRFFPVLRRPIVDIDRLLLAVGGAICFSQRVKSEVCCSVSRRFSLARIEAELMISSV